MALFHSAKSWVGEIKIVCFTREETAVVAIAINGRWNVGDS